MRTSPSRPDPARPNLPFSTLVPESPAPEDDHVQVPTVPAPYTPPCQVVPEFPPVRLGRRGGRRLLPRARRLRRRRFAAAIAVATAVLAVSAAHSATPAKPPPTRSPAHTAGPAAAPRHAAAADPLVRAPVRIADAAAVRLLRPGDRVDVLAAAHVIAAAVTVVAVPEETDAPATAPAYPEGALPSGVGDTPVVPGALVVLSVPRHVAAALSGAAGSSPLAVALC